MQNVDRDRWRCCWFVAVFVLAAFTSALGADEPAAPRKKFIELGWDIPSTALLRESWREMERAAPFDGVMFKVEAKDEQGRGLSSEAIWDGRPWKREWLQEALADLKSCRFARFTDNFVRFNATPGNIAWADDGGWSALADKAGHCAWLMKQSGGKGLAVDFESYGAQQFRFDSGQGRTFAGTAALASLMDVVVSVDTVVAHVAGAIAIPVWLMLPFAPDWRWLLSREDTPWYPTARLFRQSVAGDWDDVVDRVAYALRSLPAKPRR